MLTAKKELNYYQDQSQGTKQQTEPKRIVRRFNFKLFVWVLGAFLAALLYMSPVAVITQYGYQVNAEKEETAKIAAENQRLELEIENLSSLNRIETIATLQLGMVPAQDKDISYVDNLDLAASKESFAVNVPSMPTASQTQAGNLVVSEPVNTHPLLQTVYQIFSSISFWQ